MKKALQILPFIIITYGCTDSQKTSVTEKLHLNIGAYYLNYKLSNDTLRFQTEKYDQGGWNNTVWKITTDSIFQSDSRGLAKFIGKDRASYLFKNDTLTIKYDTKTSSQSDSKMDFIRIEKYLVLKNFNNRLDIIELRDNKPIKRSNKISTDIQLR